MAFANIGSITAQQIFATQSQPAGTKNLGPVNLPNKFSFGLLILDLSQVTDLLAVLTVNAEISLDGTNFLGVGGFILDLPNSGMTIDVGGAGLVDQFGVPFRTTVKLLKFPQAGLTTRAVRGTISLSQPAVVGMTIAIF
jgi:hypothetical protein